MPSGVIHGSPFAASGGAAAAARENAMVEKSGMRDMPA
jgi:hypothetical protein